MPFLPVDTAVVVEIGPCIDDGDFKSLETAIAYDAAGMSVDLLKNSGTAISKTDITPTTGGANDWTHKGNGVYELEISAAQNDTEGTLRVVGVCTGVLPFESPVYTVVPQAVYNSLVAGSDKLQVDAVEISSSTSAADAVETNIANLNATVSSRSTVTTAQVNAECDAALIDYDAPTYAETAALIAALNNLSSAEAQTAAAAALTAYDPPTHAELTNGLAGLNNLSIAEANAACDAALSDFCPPTYIEMMAAFGALNNLSSAEAEAAAAAALTAYDPPTHAELTSGLAGLNNLSSADVETASLAALVSIHLDHLLATDTPSLPGTSGSIVHDLLEDDGGAWRYKANALEQAPAGGGGGSVIVLGAVVGTQMASNRITEPVILEQFENHSKTYVLTVLDADGEPVDLDTPTVLQFEAFNDNGVSQFYKTKGAGIVVSGANKEVASVTVSATDAANPARLHWVLSADGQELMNGSLEIRTAARTTT